jgi:hypothetical protein
MCLNHAQAANTLRSTGTLFGTGRLSTTADSIDADSSQRPTTPERQQGQVALTVLQPNEASIKVGRRHRKGVALSCAVLRRAALCRAVPRRAALCRAVFFVLIRPTAALPIPFPHAGHH